MLIITGKVNRLTPTVEIIDSKITHTDVTQCSVHACCADIQYALHYRQRLSTMTSLTKLSAV